MDNTRMIKTFGFRVLDPLVFKYFWLAKHTFDRQKAFMDP